MGFRLMLRNMHVRVPHKQTMHMLLGGKGEGGRSEGMGKGEAVYPHTRETNDRVDEEKAEQLMSGLIRGSASTSS